MDGSGVLRIISNISLRAWSQLHKAHQRRIGQVLFVAPIKNYSEPKGSFQASAPISTYVRGHQVQAGYRDSPVPQTGLTKGAIRPRGSAYPTLVSTAELEGERCRGVHHLHMHLL